MITINSLGERTEQIRGGGAHFSKDCTLQVLGRRLRLSREHFIAVALLLLEHYHEALSLGCPSASVKTLGLTPFIHRPTNEPNDNAYPFLSSMFHSLLPFCPHRQDGRGEEKEEGKEVSKKEKKARAVNDAMPEAPFGSVLSVCKAKVQAR